MVSFMLRLDGAVCFHVVRVLFVINVKNAAIYLLCSREGLILTRKCVQLFLTTTLKLTWALV